MMESLPYLMFGAMAVAIMLGYPVAFTIGGLSLLFGLIGFGFDFFTLLPLRIWGVMTNFTLVAVPLFIFMGVMLDRSGLAEGLLQTMSGLFGRASGGMALSVVAVGGLLAASTGIVGATVVTMAVISLPQMLKRGYSHPLACGTICASSTLGQIIPPSIALIILGDIMGVSVGQLFMAAVLPGVLLILLFASFILIYTWLRPEAAPGLSAEEMSSRERSRVIRQVLGSLLPPGVLIVCVLGSIFFGIATPTEAAAVGAGGATLLTALRGRLTLRVLRDVVETTTRFSSMAFIILLCATSFGLVFRGLGGDAAIRDFLGLFGGDAWTTIIVVMALLFLLGFFLDFIEITFIVVPLVVPAVLAFGVDPLWLSILIALNFQTSFLTPPFGFALFYLKGAAPPEITTAQIYRGVIPFVGLQLIGLILVMMVPEIATWLPNTLYN